MEGDDQLNPEQTPQDQQGPPEGGAAAPLQGQSAGSNREDNRDEYYYPLPENKARFEGRVETEAGKAVQVRATENIKYDYFKSYPSYGPGAPYGDHERGEETRRQAENTSQTKAT